MRHLTLKLTVHVVACALWLAPLGGFARARAAAQTASGYAFVDLTPPGSVGSNATGASGIQQVGNAGLVGASSGQPAVNHAMLWQGAATGAVDLGAGTALAVGDGQQAGSVNNHAALWLGSAASRVDLNPSAWTQSVAAGVGGGQQVGSATRSVTCTTKKGQCPGGVRTELHPFLWSGSAASAVDLTPLVLGFGAGRALDTDGLQQVGQGFQVLGVNAFGGPFAVLWSGTAESAVNLNPSDASTSQANGVADGQQVGYGYVPHRALLWSGSAESKVELHPDGYTSSEANATNGTQQAGSGFLVNPADGAPHSHALVWSGSAASVIDLNQFLPPGYTDAAATGIDAEGNVVGWASRGPSDIAANVHAAMWKPVAAGAVFIRSLALSRSSIVAGEAVRATLTLNQPAPQGGVVVTLSHAVLTPAASTSGNSLFVQVPSAVTVAEGESGTSFDVQTTATGLEGFGAGLVVELRATLNDFTTSATLNVAPPLSVASLSVSPASVVGGGTATGTLRLNGVAPAGGALVTLASDNPAVSVPSSVVVQEGQGSATFVVNSRAVTTSVTVTLAAQYNGAVPSTATTGLTVTPVPATAADTVAIQKAEYNASKRQLSVQASSSNAAARLTVSLTANGSVIGVLTSKGGGRYEGTFNVAANPQNITVSSNFNGSASRAVTLK